MNATTWHECAVGGCGVLLELRMLMCPRHWRKVPSELKVNVMRAYRAYEKASFDNLVASVNTLRAAQDAAIASVTS